jgi:hypothetical protein
MELYVLGYDVGLGVITNKTSYVSLCFAMKQLKAL